jgi:hypothetical protein
MLWLCSPLALPSVIVFLVRSDRTLKLFFAVLLFLSVAGSLGLLWGLRADKTDFGYLILVLVPLYQFGLLALLLATLALRPFLMRKV